MKRIRRAQTGVVIAVVSAIVVTGWSTGVAYAASPAPPAAGTSAPAAAVAPVAASARQPARSAVPVATIGRLTGRSTSVALASGFVRALTSLGVKPSPQGRARVSGGVASFPITGGHVTVYKPGAVDPYVQGRIIHQGSGLNLTKGATTVSLRNFVVDPGKPAILTGEVLANGKVVASSTKLFDLDGSTLKPITTNTRAGTATLTGTTVRLSAGAAKALNGAFHTTAIKGGTVIGIATIVVNLPGHHHDRR